MKNGWEPKRIKALFYETFREPYSFLLFFKNKNSCDAGLPPGSLQDRTACDPEFPRGPGRGHHSLAEVQAAA